MGIAEEEIRKAKERGLIDYSGYGLEYNPFPMAGVAPDTARTEDIREFLDKYMCEKVREAEIRELIDRLVSTGYIEQGPGHTWLWGDWRVGKSTLLMKVFLALHDELRDAVVVYSPKPRYGITKSIMYYFLREYGATFFEDLAKCTLVKMLVENPGIVKAEWIEVWKESVKDLEGKSVDVSREYLVRQIEESALDVFTLVQDEEAVDRNRLRTTAISKLSNLEVTEEVIDLLIDPELELDDRYSRILELEKSKNFADHLVALLQACLYCDKKHVFIFIDDLEDVIRLWPRAKQTKEIDGLSSFLDRMHKGLSIVGTMHPILFELFASAHTRFVGRAAGDELNFSLVRANPLELPDLSQAVAFLLSKASRGTRPYPTYPFKDEVLKELHTVLEGKLGLVLPSLYNLLRIGAETGQRTKKYSEIDLSFYEKCKTQVLKTIS